MILFRKKSDLIIRRDDLKKNKFKIGLVPTMGALHEGHMSLIKRSIKENDYTIVSIFINPTQFNNKKDYQKYPRNFKQDLSILKKLKVDLVYLPKKDDIYNSKRKTKIKLSKTDIILCAKFRKGHFEGVIDVMDRLTKAIKPYKIFMGEKDFQQLYLINRYIKKKYNSKIVSCKTIRSNNKLALSSRNIFLKKKELDIASKFTRNIFSLKKKLHVINDIEKFLINKKKELSKLFKIKVEYLELRNKKNLKKAKKVNNSKIFFAYYINQVRLIDNF